VDRFRRKPIPTPKPTPSREAMVAHAKVEQQTKRVDRVLSEWEQVEQDVATRRGNNHAF